MEDRGSRPETKPESSVVENILQIVCLAIISATIIYLAFSWGNLPQTVPTHFNFLGSPDELGDKATLLMYPIALLAI